MKEGTHVQKKKRGKKNIMTCMRVYIFLNNILTQTTHHVRSGLRGLNVEAHFFYNTRPDPKNLDFALRAQSKLGPVICSNRKVKDNGF
jgi:hypothetical protein